MNLYIITLRRSLFFSSVSVAKAEEPKFAHGAAKKKISFRRGETRTESPFSSVPSKKRKKESKNKGKKTEKKRG